MEWAEWADYFGKPALSKDARADIWIKNIDKVTNFNRDEFRGMTKYFYDHISKKGKVEMGALTDEKFYKLWDNGFQNYLETIKENLKRRLNKMIEDKYIIGIAEAVENVRKVQNKIENEPYKNHSDLWSGADVRIENINSSNKNSYYPSAMISKLIPLCEGALWCFYQMRDIFYSKSLIKNVSKYELFGRLADAAHNYHKAHGDGNEKDLLKEISDEAMKILKEMFKSIRHGIS